MDAQGFLEADGRRLEYRWVGRRSAAPTLVFLHEGLGCLDAWRDFPDRVAEATGLGVFVYSRAGYGRSDPVELPLPVRYMHHEGLVVLPQVLEQAGIERCVLVGHSDGGSIAIVYAGSAKQPERLQGLILLAPHVFNEELSVESVRASREEYLKGDLRQRLERYHRDRVDDAFWGWNDVWLHPDFRDWNLEEYLPAICVPAILIQGKQDPYGTQRQLEAIEAGVSGPVQRVMLPACGHAPHKDRPAATLETMVTFLRTLE